MTYNLKPSLNELAAKFRANAAAIEDRPGDKSATECAASLIWRYVASDLESALAQQAQPTCGFAQGYEEGWKAHRIYSAAKQVQPKCEHGWYVPHIKYEGMPHEERCGGPQQAQPPYKCEKCGATFENWRCTKCMDHVRAQQAQHDEFDHGFQEGSEAGYAQRLLELLDAQQVQPTCGKPAGELVCNNVAGHAGRCGWTSLREQTQPEHVDGKDCPRCNVVLGRYAQPENVDREMIAEAIAPLFLGPDAYNLKYRLKIADAVLAFFAAHGVKRRGLTP